MRTWQLVFERAFRFGGLPSPAPGRHSCLAHLVFAAYSFVQYRRVLPLLTDPKATLAPRGEVLSDHRQWHTQQTVRAIAARARQGYSDDQIAAEFFPT